MKRDYSGAKTILEVLLNSVSMPNSHLTHFSSFQNQRMRNGSPFVAFIWATIERLSMTTRKSKQQFYRHWPNRLAMENDWIWISPCACSIWACTRKVSRSWERFQIHRRRHDCFSTWCKSWTTRTVWWNFMRHWRISSRTNWASLECTTSEDITRRRLIFTSDCCWTTSKIRYFLNIVSIMNASEYF